MRNLFYSVLAVSCMFLLLEVGARIYLHYWSPPGRFRTYATLEELSDRYPLRQIPDRHMSLVTAPNFSSGLDRHNRLGFRGGDIEIPKPRKTFRIATIGGSTTYSSGVMVHTFSYPFVLQEYLRRCGFENVEVVNGGIPGATSLESLINFETRVLETEPDLVIVCDGINDIFPRMVWPPSSYRADQSGYIVSVGFLNNHSVLEYSLLYRIVMIKLGSILPQSSVYRVMKFSPDNMGTDFERQVSGGIYPDGLFRSVSMDSILKTNRPVYLEMNLKNLISMAQGRGIGVVLLTSPYCAYSLGTSMATREWKEALDEHNELVRRVGMDRGVPVIDLAAAIPDDKSLFTDHIHFSIRGNWVRARLISDGLVSSGLLTKK